MIRIEPYKSFSGGAKALSIRAGVLRATQKQVRKHGSFNTIINWGNSQRRFDNARYINTPEAVNLASNKLEAAKAFTEGGTPSAAWWSSKSDASRYFRVDKKSDSSLHKLREQFEAEDNCNDTRGSGGILCRKLTRGSGGRGIVLATTEEELVDAPLYVMYVKKTDEYRVHVFDGQVIDVQQKRKRQEIPNEEIDYQIRNADNGWVYCRGGVAAPDDVKAASILAVDSLGLTFGAVDVGFNAKYSRTVVYEVNTAPGLEGTTLDSYYNAFCKALPELQRGAYSRRRSMARA